MSVQENPAEKEGTFRRTLRKFIKFMAASGVSTLLDLGLFYALQKWVDPYIWPQPVALPPFIPDVGIFCATIVARVCSATVNFMLNRKFVFKLQGHKGAIPKYILLCTVIMLVGGFVVGKLTNLLPKEEPPFVTTLIKAGVDTILFVVNFFVQKTWVFPQKQQTEEK